MITDIKNDFDEIILNSKGLFIVDFWAPWCGPCKMFAPVFEEASKNYKNINFYKLNVDEDEKDVSRKLGVMSIPTTIIFKDGKEIKRNIGFLDKDSLNEFLENI